MTDQHDASIPSRRQIARWRRYLANERAEAAVYRELAHRKTGEEREILLALAHSESRHEHYWRTKLGDHVGMPRQPDLSTRFMGFLARRFGSVFVLAMMQNAESRSAYVDDADASHQIAADERIHAEVVRGLAARGREQMSGAFRAAVFGANDGLVSNLALVMGVMGSGVSSNIVLLTGISGLLSGALSMAAGEYISVKSQEELLEASEPDEATSAVLPELDVDANELALVYRARGMSQEEAEERAHNVFRTLIKDGDQRHSDTFGRGQGNAIGTGGAWQAAISSFFCFASGALLPVLPFLFGLRLETAGIIALVLVALALLCTGGITGILSGKPPLSRAFRQLFIGLGAAAVTWGLGLVFGQVAG
ncbi:rubrerythrin family protein [Corynebacterium poyangense]|uniref:Rubrerythrin family protein n=2 Tax=Corynebacterium poyangense TaxID=2684405 RepID=A0A7H0SSF0_9CORY|nr:VIT1/CCC1 transporter family protein [Corynebacterium poyangense]MBZ8178433.1 rubrerythrin family protein [Corynebacterium poyangense]QNQ91475.1 rubrerythrin family protein [Corynebacterium poyangense]